MGGLFDSGIAVGVGVGVCGGVGVGGCVIVGNAGCVIVGNAVGVGVTEVVSWHDIAGINKPISIASEMRDVRILLIALPL